MKHIILLLLVFSLLTCKEEKRDITNTEEPTQKDVVFDDSDYVLNADYEVGDVRRYGIYPDSIHSFGHPFTKKTRIETVLDLSQDHNIEMTFPKGYYKLALILKGKSNLVLNFNEAEFGGMVQILEKDSMYSSNIELKGKLITYGGLFTRKTSNLKVDDLVIKSNSEKSIYNIKSKGCHLYAESKNITINNLSVEDVGSGTIDFKYVHAGLMINGKGTQNVKINKVLIQSSDRHGVYISGSDHLIGDIVIENFGMGSMVEMAPIQSTIKGEEKLFKGLWINKAYDGFIETITVNEKKSKGKYTAQFESGNIDMPFTIGKLTVLNRNLSINKKESSGVIIELQE